MVSDNDKEVHVIFANFTSQKSAKVKGKTSLVGFRAIEPFYSYYVKYAKEFQKLVKNSVWTRTDLDGLRRTQTDSNGPKWTQTDLDGLSWIQMDLDGLKQT